MNTLANHGYISCTRIVTVSEVINASSNVFNMGADVSAIIAGISVVFDGDIPSLMFSIGGADARQYHSMISFPSLCVIVVFPGTSSLGILGGILGTETGLDGHSRAEGDSSATR
jgi:hypothetical protein